VGKTGEIPFLAALISLAPIRSIADIPREATSGTSPSAANLSPQLDLSVPHASEADEGPRTGQEEVPPPAPGNAKGGEPDTTQVEPRAQEEEEGGDEHQQLMSPGIATPEARSECGSEAPEAQPMVEWTVGGSNLPGAQGVMSTETSVTRLLADERLLISPLEQARQQSAEVEPSVLELLGSAAYSPSRRVVASGTQRTKRKRWRGAHESPERSASLMVNKMRRHYMSDTSDSNWLAKPSMSLLTPTRCESIATPPLRFGSPVGKNEPRGRQAILQAKRRHLETLLREQEKLFHEQHRRHVRKAAKKLEEGIAEIEHRAAMEFELGETVADKSRQQMVYERLRSQRGLQLPCLPPKPRNLGQRPRLSKVNRSYEQAKVSPTMMTMERERARPARRTPGLDPQFTASGSIELGESDDGHSEGSSLGPAPRRQRGLMIYSNWGMPHSAAAEIREERKFLRDLSGTGNPDAVLRVHGIKSTPGAIPVYSKKPPVRAPTGVPRWYNTPLQGSSRPASTLAPIRRPVAKRSAKADHPMDLLSNTAPL